VSVPAPDRWLRMGRALAAAAILACTAAPPGEAAEFRVAPYLWNAGFKGSLGAADAGGPANGDFSGLLDNLEVSGFMLHADWRRDRWSVFGDWSHMDVSSSAPSPRGALFSGVEGSIAGNIMQAAAGYRVQGDAAAGVDLFAGLRYYDLELTLALRPGVLAARNAAATDDWVDGLVGVRWSGRSGANWEFGFYSDIGAGGSDRSWQAAAQASYRFSWGSLVGGWRHLDVKYENGAYRLDAALSGPFFGAIFRF
jgi:hypothetical protein